MTSTSVKMIHSLYKEGGEGSPSNPLKFKGQDYKQLKETALKSGKKFEDVTFPANHHSLGKLELTPEQTIQVTWSRPHDLNPEASFFVDGPSRLDFKQGEVGNCWFLSSVGVLTLRKDLIEKVVPPGQSLKDDYAGIFHFVVQYNVLSVSKFWRFGKWVDVVIDDMLPTRNGVPVSVSSRSGKEFWAPLLEKAYAKLCGSYGDMIAGHTSEAFKDLSGGVHMSYTLSKSPADLWDVMNRAVQCKTLMGCGTFLGERGKQIFEQFGLVDSHAFAVTGVKQVTSKGNKENLVRIWNPWGAKEWNGDWSDKSELWNTISAEERDQCRKVSNDGEFWMKMKDFVVYFQEMDICCDSPNFIDGDAACQWNCSLKEGRWEAGKTACGSQPGEEEFWSNPQYRLTVKKESKGEKNVLLSLLQKPDEEHRSKVKYPYIGIFIYKVPPKAPKGQLPYSLFMYEGPLKASVFTNMRELIEFHSLEPGEYLIIPCTYYPGKTSSFIITMYSKADAQIE